MLIHRYLILAGLICCVVGCAANGSVTSIGGTLTKLKSLRVSPEGFIRVVDGDVFRKIPLSQLASVTIAHETVSTIDRALYCRAAISFVDGSTLGTLKRTDTVDKIVWICGSDVIVGTAAGGPMKVAVMELTRIDVDHR